MCDKKPSPLVAVAATFLEMSDTSLYVHIPFCAQQCDFCTFYVEPTRGGRIGEFLSALEKELATVVASEPFTPQTIFFGGGTPSVLNIRQFDQLFTRMRHLGLLSDSTRELTVEVTPSTVSLDKARLLRGHGVNRISMGVQSLDEALLDRLGRVHSVDAVHQSFDTLRRAGFDNINLDLIFAIPGQTPRIWLETLSEIIALDPEHISTYELTYEEGSAMTAKKEAGIFRPPDEETIVEMYETAISTLADAGYAQYEISNFSKRDRRCAHNLNYWFGGDCVAAGPSAAGYWHGMRYKNVPDLDAYIKMLSRGERPIAFSETLPPRQRAGELAAFAIRMNDGIDAKWFRSRTGFTLEELWSLEITDLTTEGFADFDGHCLRLTPNGRLVADSVAERLVILSETTELPQPKT